jgi:purine-binding chemotaxis protein CheW
MQRSTTTQTTRTTQTARYLCVDLGSEHYAIPILCVREIQAFTLPTPLPRMPAHLRGVANLHGTIVPVIDLRLRMGMPEQAFGRLTVTVFVGLGEQVAGLIVDAASRVVDLEQAQIKPPPAMASSVDTSFIAGIAKPGDRAIVVLDIEALLRGDPALAASGAAMQKLAPELGKDS